MGWLRRRNEDALASKQDLSWPRKEVIVHGIQAMSFVVICFFTGVYTYIGDVSVCMCIYRYIYIYTNHIYIYIPSIDL